MGFSPALAWRDPRILPQAFTHSIRPLARRFAGSAHRGLAGTRADLASAGARALGYLLWDVYTAAPGWPLRLLFPCPACKGRASGRFRTPAASGVHRVAFLYLSSTPTTGDEKARPLGFSHSKIGYCVVFEPRTVQVAVSCRFARYKQAARSRWC